MENNDYRLTRLQKMYHAKDTEMAYETLDTMPYDRTAANPIFASFCRNVRSSFSFLVKGFFMRCHSDKFVVSSSLLSSVASKDDDSSSASEAESPSTFDSDSSSADDEDAKKS